MCVCVCVCVCVCACVCAHKKTTKQVLTLSASPAPGVWPSAPPSCRPGRWSGPLGTSRRLPSRPAPRDPPRGKRRPTAATPAPAFLVPWVRLAFPPFAVPWRGYSLWALDVRSGSSAYSVNPRGGVCVWAGLAHACKTQSLMGEPGLGTESLVNSPERWGEGGGSVGGAAGTKGEED